MRKAIRNPPSRGGAAAIGAGSSMFRERSQDSFVSIHFWRGVLGNGCLDSAHHDPLASPNPLVLRKRRLRANLRPAPQPRPSQPSPVSTTYTPATTATAT